MPSDSLQRPRLLKGALAVYSPADSRESPRLIPFQYNPEQVRRTLAQRAAPPETGRRAPAREDVFRLSGPPVETINLSIILDAVDQLEHPDQNRTVREHGLQPSLALFELLLYPPLRQQQRQRDQARNGQAQVTSARLPLVLLVWGRNRVAPVQITSFSVTEEAFDLDLNPIAAKVELGLRVLTTADLPAGHLGAEAFESYQRNKEQLVENQGRGNDDQRQRDLLPRH